MQNHAGKFVTQRSRVIVTARLFQYVGACALFGGAVFQVLNARTPRVASDNRLLSLFGFSAAGVVIGAGFWLVAQTAMMTETPFAQLHGADLASVAFSTSFGRVDVGRLLLALTCLGLLSIARRHSFAPALVLVSGGLIASFAWTGHGAAGDGVAGAVHLTADIIHLLAAGLWLGAFGPLLFLIITSSPQAHSADAIDAHAALARFSTPGSVAVGALVLTGIINSWVVIGPDHLWHSLHTTYGKALLVKLVLFAGMLALAATNRFAHTPALARAIGQGATIDPALSALRRSIIIEAGLGLLVLAIVSWLGTLAPIALSMS